MKILRKVALGTGLSFIALSLFAKDLRPSQNTTVENTESSVTTAPMTFNSSFTAIEVTRLMGNGVNLGNTMEAYRTENMGTKRPATDYEVLWGQPVTTEKQMKAYKKAGFDSIRIPVAWTNAMDYENGDYRIGTQYLDRIETLVNWAIKADLYVIINDHWDGDWWGMFGSANESTRNDAMELYTKMWTQISERFKNYNEKLIFEGGNEELGSRLNDKDVCKDSGSLSEDQCYETAALINQTFVNIVRSSGANNSMRYLLIPGYNTDIGKTCDERFSMPKDTENGRLIVSVHYYTPWAFCGDGASAEHWGTKKELDEMNTNLSRMKKFTDAGYGVIIGEFQACQNNGKVNPYSAVYFENMYDLCDKLDLCPMLWECNTWFDKKTGKIRDADIAKIISSRNVRKQGKKFSRTTEKAESSLAARYSSAPERFNTSNFYGVTDKAFAWIMYASGDWQATYSVGDVYNPDSKSQGLTPYDIEITGEGEYTVSLDFSGMNNGAGKAEGTSFCALGIGNGESVCPGWTIDIIKILVNGEEIPLTAKPFTSSDDGKCTRVNIYNEWIPGISAGARTSDGSTEGCKAIIVDRNRLHNMKTFSIVFRYSKPSAEN